MKAFFVCATLAGMASVSFAQPANKPQPVSADIVSLLARLDALEKSNRKLIEQVADLTAQLKAQKKDSLVLPFNYMTFTQLVNAGASNQSRLVIPVVKDPNNSAFDLAPTGISNTVPGGSVKIKPSKIRDN